MMLITMFCIFIMIIILTIMVMTLVKKLSLNKMTRFECGFNAMLSKRLPFCTHFFIIGIMFLIFDIIIVMPMILTMKLSMMKYWILSSMFMILTFIFGLYHEWKNGMLKWTK